MRANEFSRHSGNPQMIGAHQKFTGALDEAFISTKGAGTMQPRIDVTKVDPKAYQAMFALTTYLQHSGLEEPLLTLVEMRASQINGCAYCLDMHSKDARAAGETEQRLYGLDAWEEAPYYSARERAALAWTEAVTLVADGHVPDKIFEEVRKQFSEAELVALTMAVVTINSWNRLAISFRAPAGTYQPKARHEAAGAAKKSA
jgi:AhpD family alkylhydroperoxidase